MNRFFALLLGCMMVAPSAWSAEPDTSSEKSIAVPSYMNFLSVCVPYVLDDIPKNSLAAQDLVLASSMLCHCAYEDVSKVPTFTDSSFTAAISSCSARARQNPAAFDAQYRQKLQRAMAEVPSKSTSSQRSPSSAD